jgi:hypothetical protein
VVRTVTVPPGANTWTLGFCSLLWLIPWLAIYRGLLTKTPEFAAYVWVPTLDDFRTLAIVGRDVVYP